MGILGFGLGVCKRKQAPSTNKVDVLKSKANTVTAKTNTDSTSKSEETKKYTKKQVSEEKVTKVKKSYWNFPK